MDDALRKLLRPGICSDLVLKCQPYTFNVHRAIICTRSEYFTAACKPDAFKEGQEGVIELKAATEDSEDVDIDADDPDAVKQMINFLYTANYDVIKLDAIGSVKRSKREIARTPAPATSAPVIMHAKMYALGSKYGIDELKRTAASKYEEAVKDAWDSADFARVIRMVYTTTPDEDTVLRQITTETILEHKDVVLAREDIEAAVIGIDRLAYALLKGIPKLTPGPQCSLCGNARAWHCQNDFRWGCGLTVLICDCEGTKTCPNCGPHD